MTKSRSAERGLVNLLAHQEEVCEDFVTLEDLAVAFHQTDENYRDLKLSVDFDFHTTNMMFVVRPAEVSGMAIHNKSGLTNANTPQLNSASGLFERYDPRDMGVQSVTLRPRWS